MANSAGLPLGKQLHYHPYTQGRVRLPARIRYLQHANIQAHSTNRIALGRPLPSAHCARGHGPWEQQRRRRSGG